MYFYVAYVFSIGETMNGSRNKSNVNTWSKTQTCVNVR